MAIDASGDVAAGNDYEYSPDLYIYHAGGATPLNTYSLAQPTSGISLMPRSLAWSPDGSHLFVVLKTTSSSYYVPTAYSLQVIDYPTLLPTSLSVSTPSAAYTYEPTVQVTAHLGTTATNRTVSIYAQPAGSTTKTLLKTAAVDSSGNLTVSYTAARNTTFSAVFSGDSSYAPATATTAISVKAQVSESLSGYYGSTVVGGTTYRLYHSYSLVHVHATVTPNKSGQCVKFEVQSFYQGAWHPNLTTSCTKLSSSSTVSVAFG